MVQIVQQVNRNGHADFAILRRILYARWIEVRNPKLRALEDYLNIGPGKAKDEDLIPMAHQHLCTDFNSHLPKLFPIDGEVIELPNVDVTGIRDALYFQLRLDYLAQRTIGTCLNCGGHFTVFKRGTQGCSEACRESTQKSEVLEQKQGHN